MAKNIEIAGRSLRMHYTVNALCAVEERAGVSLDSLMDRQFTAVRLLLWGGLTHFQPEMTPEDAGELIGAHIRSGGTLEEIVNICAQGLGEAGFFAPEDM